MRLASSRLSLLVGVVVVVAQAATPIATMRGSGTVKIGGTKLQAAGVPSWPVVAGDRIATEADGVAVVSSSQVGRLEIRSNSEVDLADDHIVLRKGVVGSDRLAVQLEGYTIRAEDANSATNWFVVSRQDGKPLIAAHRGDVLVTRAGAAALLVPAGSYASPAPPQGDKKKDDDKKERRGGAATAGSAAGWTIGTLSHAQSIAVVAGIGAAAATGTAVGLSGGDETPPVRSVSE